MPISKKDLNTETFIDSCPMCEMPAPRCTCTDDTIYDFGGKYESRGDMGIFEDYSGPEKPA
jgi:hypothetical protein